MTTPRYREGTPARDASVRFEGNATPATGKLLRLFKRTLKDQTPQQRRLLAGDIALEIPSEAVTRGQPEPLWMQRLRSFVRRELDLDLPPQPSPWAGVATPDDEALEAGITSAGDRIGETNGKQHVSASHDRRGGRPAISPAKARGLLLARVKHFRESRGSMELLTNVGLAKATRPPRDEETIGNWLRRAGWTLDDLDDASERLRPKKPE